MGREVVAVGNLEAQGEKARLRDRIEHRNLNARREQASIAAIRRRGNPPLPLVVGGPGISGGISKRGRCVRCADPAGRARGIRRTARGGERWPISESVRRAIVNKDFVITGGPQHEINRANDYDDRWASGMRGNIMQRRS